MPDTGFFPSANGSVSPGERFANLERRIDAIWTKIEKLEDAINDMKVSVVRITGGIVGAGVVVNIVIALLGLYWKTK